MITQNFSKGSLLSVKVILFNKSEQTICGICLKKKNQGLNSSFTIKHTTNGKVAIQTFPLYSPFIKEIYNLDTNTSLSFAGGSLSSGPAAPRPASRADLAEIRQPNALSSTPT